MKYYGQQCIPSNSEQHQFQGTDKHNMNCTPKMSSGISYKFWNFGKLETTRHLNSYYTIRPNCQLILLNELLSLLIYVCNYITPA